MIKLTHKFEDKIPTFVFKIDTWLHSEQNPPFNSLQFLYTTEIFSPKSTWVGIILMCLISVSKASHFSWLKMHKIWLGPRNTRKRKVHSNSKRAMNLLWFGMKKREFLIAHKKKLRFKYFLLHSLSFHSPWIFSYPRKHFLFAFMIQTSNNFVPPLLAHPLSPAESPIYAREALEFEQFYIYENVWQLRWVFFLKVRVYARIINSESCSIQLGEAKFFFYFVSA